MEIKVKRLNPKAKLPKYAHPGDAGMDLFALDAFALEPGERKLINLGFCVEIPHGHVGFVKDKSGLANEQGLHIMAGVIDAGYRGEYKILFINLGNSKIEIEAGQKVTQMVVLPVPEFEIVEVEELSNSSRGEGGYGSTGKF